MGQGDPGGQDQAGLGSIVTARKGELAMSYGRVTSVVLPRRTTMQNMAIMQPPVIEHAPRAPGRPPLPCDRGRGSRL